MQPQNFYSQPTQYSNNQKLPPSQKIADFIRKHRALSLIIILLVIFIPLGFIILTISSLITPTVEPEDIRQPEVAPLPYVEYQDREKFEELIGDKLSIEILAEVSNIIVTDNEIISAPSPLEVAADTAPVYTISIKEAPFTPPADEKYLFMKFLVTIDDGREYTLWFRTDQDYAAEYVVVVLDRLDSKDIPDYILEYINEDDAIPSTITTWIDSLHLTDPQVETFPLPAVPHFSDYD